MTTGKAQTKDPNGTKKAARARLLEEGYPEVTKWEYPH